MSPRKNRRNNEIRRTQLQHRGSSHGLTVVQSRLRVSFGWLNGRAPTNEPAGGSPDGAANLRISVVLIHDGLHIAWTTGGVCACVCVGGDGQRGAWAAGARAPEAGLHIWLATSQVGRKFGQQCTWRTARKGSVLATKAVDTPGQRECRTLSSQQVAPGVGQQPQPGAGSDEPGSWQLHNNTGR